MHVKGIFDDLYSGNILGKHYLYVKIIYIGKSTMIDNPVAYFIKPGTEKHKRHGKYQSHLAYELWNVPASKVIVKTYLFNGLYIFEDF